MNFIIHGIGIACGIFLIYKFVSWLRSTKSELDQYENWVRNETEELSIDEKAEFFEIERIKLDDKDIQIDRMLLCCILRLIKKLGPNAKRFLATELHKDQELLDPDNPNHLMSIKIFSGPYFFL